MSSKLSVAFLGICGLLIVSLTAGVAYAAKSCCNNVNKIGGCSGCIYWDNGNNTHWCMDIGDHGGKKCGLTTGEKSCDEELRDCATVSAGTTKYTCNALAKNCLVSSGVTTADYTIQVNQCGGDDDAC